MNFNANDIEQFLSQKEFIDTALVPLLPVDFSMEVGKQSGSAAEYLMSLTTFIEKQFKGRIFLTPPFPYFQNLCNIDINEIEDKLKQSGFKFVLFITCDQFWKKENGDLHIIWLPAIPLESMDMEVKMRILQDQLNLVIPSLTKCWTN